MKVLKIKDGSKLPQKQEKDSSYDIFACLDKSVCVNFGEVVAIPTGIKIRLPENYHAHIRGRSGLAMKHGVVIIGGVIDSQYLGEWIVLLTTAKKDCSLIINSGDKIAQFKLEKDETFSVQEVFSEEDLGTSERGEKGFGSSGS